AHLDDVDVASERLAVARAGDAHALPAGPGHSAGGGEHARHVAAGGQYRGTAGFVDLPDDRYQVAEAGGQQDVDLRNDHEAAVLQELGDLAFGRRQGHAGDVYGTDQRVADGAALRDARVHGQVGVLEHADLQDVARHQ